MKTLVVLFFVLFVSVAWAQDEVNTELKKELNQLQLQSLQLGAQIELNNQNILDFNKRSYLLREARQKISVKIQELSQKLAAITAKSKVKNP